MAAGFVAPTGALAATITVNDDGEAVANDGACTYREALTAANDNQASGPLPGECPAGDPGATVRDVVEFDLGMGVHVLEPATQYPVVTDSIEIDGTNGTAGPRIELNGSNAPADAEGIFLTTGSDGSYVHDVAVYGFGDDGFVLFSSNNLLADAISGTFLAGNASGLGNEEHGIKVFGDDNRIERVLASGNDLNGIDIDPSADRTVIVGSRIGTTKTGDAALVNGGAGILINSSSVEAADDTRIGGTARITPNGTCTGDCNLISGNTSDAINIRSASIPITGTEITGNHIGVDLAGADPLENFGAGVAIQGVVNDTEVAGNVVGANASDGITVGTVSNADVTTGPSDVRITGNRVGTDTTGTLPLGNGGEGIRVNSDITSGYDPLTGVSIGGSQGLTPGGACTGDCNVVGDNGGFAGVAISGSGVRETTVVGNHLGTNSAGTASLPNVQHGLSLGAVGDVGVGSAAAPNMISGNTLVGIDVIGEDTNARIESNLIGVASDGVSPLPNGEDGIRVFSQTTGSTIGGTAPQAGNVIAHNGEAGIDVWGSVPPESAAPILGNSIHSNAELGIELKPDGLTEGVTPNDGPGDADGGANGFQNFPELEAVAAIGGETVAAGTLASAPSARFRIELFANDAADPSGHGEGQTYLGAFEVTTDAGGNARFLETIGGAAALGRRISATATLLSAAGQPLVTSEFSATINEGCTATGTEGNDAAGAFVVGAGTDIVCGLGGDDTLPASGGVDLLVGGDGTDTADFTGTDAGVTASLATDLVSDDGTGSTDELDGIENLTGSAGADTLEGDGVANTLLGGGGRDDLAGGGGDDTVKGGGGDRDEVRGNGGKDRVKGGGGKRDDVRGGGAKDKLDGGGGKRDSCDGGGGKDRKQAPGCEEKKSLP